MDRYENKLRQRSGSSFIFQNEDFFVEENYSNYTLRLVITWIKSPVKELVRECKEQEKGRYIQLQCDLRYVREKKCCDLVVL